MFRFDSDLMGFSAKLFVERSRSADAEKLLAYFTPKIALRTTGGSGNVAFSPDGRFIAGGSTIMGCQYRADGIVKSLDFNAYGSRLVSGNYYQKAIEGRFHSN